MVGETAAVGEGRGAGEWRGAEAVVMGGVGQGVVVAG